MTNDVRPGSLRSYSKVKTQGPRKSFINEKQKGKWIKWRREIGGHKLDHSEAGGESANPKYAFWDIDYFKLDIFKK